MSLSSGRLLGIDYGTKRIGLAISDEGQTLAFPKTIIANDGQVLDTIRDIIKEESITAIVIGESRDLKGEANPILEEIKKFSESLTPAFGLSVHFQKEFLTSVEARRYEMNGENVDAAAAALILQRYLDIMNKQAKQ